MIQVVQGFKVSTRDAIDNRILLSKEEMIAVNDNQMPDKYFAVCKDDGMLYLYDKSSEASAETGKFTLYSSSKIESISINGVELPVENANVDLPLATASRYGVVMIGNGLKIDENGFITLDFNTVEDGSIPYQKVDFTGSIIDGNITII